MNVTNHQAATIARLLRSALFVALLGTSAFWAWPDSVHGVGGSNSIVGADGVGDIGYHTSLVLDSAGFPVVSYQGNNDLKILHCNDANCDPATNGPESITSPDASGAVGFYTSLALTTSGHPVVSYNANGDLKILHCNDPNCVGGVITAPDTAGDVGTYTSLVLDSSGYPVVSYHDQTNGDLKLLHCGNPYCTSGNSITAPDTDDGTNTSLVLDSAGNPVITYHRWGDMVVKLLHCDDPNCAGDETGNSSVLATAAARSTSVALNSSGNPVVAYYWSNLKLMFCNDPKCTGGDELVNSPDTLGD